MCSCVCVYMNAHLSPQFPPLDRKRHTFQKKPKEVIQHILWAFVKLSVVMASWFRHERNNYPVLEKEQLNKRQHFVHFCTCVCVRVRACTHACERAGRARVCVCVCSYCMKASQSQPAIISTGAVWIIHSGKCLKMASWSVNGRTRAFSPSSNQQLFRANHACYGYIVFGEI